MSGDLAALCGCVGDCRCRLVGFTGQKSMGKLKKERLGQDKPPIIPNKNQNRQRSGDESNPNSPKITKKQKRGNASNSNNNLSSNEEKERRIAFTKAATKSLPPSIKQKPTGMGERTFLYEPKTLHVLQPHCHRRHYNHHLLDHFSSDQILFCQEKAPRRDVRSEIIPTRTSCEYKDTNFITEGSPPLTRRTNPSKKLTQSANDSVNTDLDVNFNQTEIQDKHPSYPASVWKEPSHPPEVNVKSINGCGAKRPNSCGVRTSDYLNKFKNESVCGPGNGNSKTRLGKHQQQKETLNSGYVKSCVKAWDQRSQTRTQYLRERFKKSSLAKNNCKDQDCKVSSSKHSPCFVPSTFGEIRNLTGKTQRTRVPPKSLKLNVCQICMDRNSIIKMDASAQTEQMGDHQMTQESQTDGQLQHVKETVNLPPLDDFDYDEQSSAASSCAAGDYFDENSSSDTSFDDNELDDIFEPQQRPVAYFKRDLQNRITKLQSILRRMRHNVATFTREQHLQNIVLALVDELDQIVLEVYELYDDFDSEIGQDQQELEDLKKQLQQYKRTCRVLEYDLMRADIQSNDNSQVVELQEEIRVSRHVAVSLNRELQTADDKLKEYQKDSDSFRQKLTDSEVQRTVLEREVVLLRNAVDQMSLHASAVPLPDCNTTTNRETLPELRHQIRFLGDEKDAILTKLMETDQEKDNLQLKLERYLHRYGEIGVSDRSIEEEEWKSNDLKIRILMAEDQAGALGRKTIQLQLENENLSQQLQQLNEKVKEDAEMPRNLSASDLLFLEDEVEALRMTLDEMEEENCSLRNRLDQTTEKLLKYKKPPKSVKGTQTELHGLSTPSPLSEKILTWDLGNESPPHSIFSENIKTTSEIQFSAAKSSLQSPFAIDEATQTVDVDRLDDTEEIWSQFESKPTTPGAIDEATQTTLPYYEESFMLLDQPWAVKQPSPSPTSISRQLVDILTKSKEVDVEFLVSQLTDLALATRSLVDESPSSHPLPDTSEEYCWTYSHNSEKSSTQEDIASISPLTKTLEQEKVITVIAKEETKRIPANSNLPTLVQQPSTIQLHDTPLTTNLFQILLLCLLIWMILTNLTLITLVKFFLLTVCFFII
ncbi:uncharacterized protein LOC143457037 [Clavelina lepadiformis]|uniref:uncharacterized protein LOC143457037 n=1 Tax=Clavelina lepadiformis TaxID=159417 RepID=UPI0040410474